MKNCTRCKRSKPLDEFRSRSWAPHLLMSWCKACEHTYSKQDAPNRKWTVLSHRIRRKTGCGPSPSELRLGLGEPESCYLCAGSLLWKDAELDHIVPVSKGGQSTIDNLAWTHRRCNRLKHDFTIDELRELLPLILENIVETV